MSTQNVQDQLNEALLNQANDLLAENQKKDGAYFLRKEGKQYKLYQVNTTFNVFGAEIFSSELSGDVTVQAGKIVWPVPPAEIFTAQQMQELALSVGDQKEEKDHCDHSHGSDHVCPTADAMRGTLAQLKENENKNKNKTKAVLQILNDVLPPLPEKLDKAGWFIEKQDGDKLSVLQVESLCSPFNGKQLFVLVDCAELAVVNGVVKVNSLGTALYDIVSKKTLEMLVEVDANNSKHQPPVENRYNYYEPRPGIK